jgi:hypothetical protein
MKQTAVEFLHSEYKRILGDKLVDIQKVFEISDIFAKANEIFEEQIIEAGNSCALKQHLHSDKINKMTESELRQFAEEDVLTFGEEYYNETFNK